MFFLVLCQVVERGAGYLETELKRLQGLLGGSVTPEKKTLFMLRTNILKAFVEAGIGRETAAAAAADTPKEL